MALVGSDRREPHGTPESPTVRRCPREGSAWLLEQHWLRKADDREGALDLDAVRPAVAEVVKVFERFGAGVFDRRQQRGLARVERTISPVLIRQIKADVEDAEFVEVAVGPAHRRLQHFIKAM